jgi:hypothetical protein
MAADGMRQPALRGVIQFTRDWEPILLRFKPASVSGEPSRRTQLNQIYAQLKLELTDVSLL